MPLVAPIEETPENSLACYMKSYNNIVRGFFGDICNPKESSGHIDFKRLAAITKRKVLQSKGGHQKGAKLTPVELNNIWMHCICCTHAKANGCPVATWENAESIKTAYESGMLPRYSPPSPPSPPSPVSPPPVPAPEEENDDDDDAWLESVIAMEEELVAQGGNNNNNNNNNAMEIDVELPSVPANDKCRSTVRQFLRDKGIDGFEDLEKKVELNACIAYNIEHNVSPLLDRTNNTSYNSYIYDADTPEKLDKLLMDATVRTMFIKAEEARKLGWNTLFNPPPGIENNTTEEPIVATEENETTPLIINISE